MTVEPAHRQLFARSTFGSAHERRTECLRTNSDCRTNRPLAARWLDSRVSRLKLRFDSRECLRTSNRHTASGTIVRQAPAKSCDQAIQGSTRKLVRQSGALTDVEPTFGSTLGSAHGRRTGHWFHTRERSRTSNRTLVRHSGALTNVEPNIGSTLGGACDTREYGLCTFRLHVFIVCVFSCCC